MIENQHRWDKPSMKNAKGEVYETVQNFRQALKKGTAYHYTAIRFYVELLLKKNVRFVKEDGVANHFSYYPVTPENTVVIGVYM